MSRTKRMLHSLASGYVSMAANIVYTMASVPLALHYLSKTEFGLWLLITQVSTYFLMLDLGLNSSVSRLLVDHKDDKNGGKYGSLLKTSYLVFGIQGLAVAALGTLASTALPALLNVPPESHQEFVILMSLQCISLGVGLFLRSLGAPLWGHQRNDIGNYASTLIFAINFTCLWWGFHQGWGIYSLVLPSLAGLIPILLVNLIAVSRLKLLPAPGCWGRISTETFKELFKFGADVFLYQLGWQFVSASQTIIVSNTMGLAAAATWVIATKLFVLAQQIVWRPFDYSAGGISEMIVRSEKTRLQERFIDLVVLSGSLSVFVGIGVALINPTFLTLWTAGRVAWWSGNNWLLALLLVVYSITRCHTGLLGLRKELHTLRYLYFVEGLIFVFAAWKLTPVFGFPAVPITAIIANLCLSGIYGIRQTITFFGISFYELMCRCRPTLLFFCTFVSITFLIPHQLTAKPNWGSLVLVVGIAGAVGTILFITVGLTKPMAQMIRQRIFWVASFAKNSNTTRND